MRIHTANIPITPDVNLDLLSRKIVGMSGADIANLCNEAALVAARDLHKQVSMTDFEEAIDKIILGGVRPSVTDPNARRVAAYHESGHATVAWLTPVADIVHKVTIIPHGRALGITEQVPAEEQYNYSRTYLVAPIDVMLGGPYVLHSNEHRICEMTMDSLLFHDLSGSELEYARWIKHLDSCQADPKEFGDLMDFWKDILLKRLILKEQVMILTPVLGSARKLPHLVLQRGTMGSRRFSDI